MRLAGLHDRRRDARCRPASPSPPRPTTVRSRRPAWRRRSAAPDQAATPTISRGVDAVSAEIRDEIVNHCRCPSRCGRRSGTPTTTLQAAVRRTTCRSPYAPRPPPRTCPAPASPGSRTPTSGSTAPTRCCDHVRQCWASLYTSRAIIYRLRNDIPDEGLSMAVAVQKMVNARVSGVAITLNPPTATARRSRSTRPTGVGEMVVIRPGHARQHRPRQGDAQRRRARRSATSTPNWSPDASGRRAGGARGRRRSGAPALPDRRRADGRRPLAKRAEKHYGCPQDIEWALDADLPDGENLSAAPVPARDRPLRKVAPARRATGPYHVTCSSLHVLRIASTRLDRPARRPRTAARPAHDRRPMPAHP